MGTAEVTESVTGNMVDAVGSGGSLGYYSIPRPTRQALATRQAL